ncbi:hypothetical protein EVA_20320 [gut metagenome]|uniref:Uncharacterized protein n=1 Tax=gut metagenome TaxID=749906 RepID=J9FAY0_9ZZZZ
MGEILNHNTLLLEVHVEIRVAHAIIGVIFQKIVLHLEFVRGNPVVISLAKCKVGGSFAPF